MFKKFMSLMMVVCIFTVQAHAANQNGLKAAFDEMNYALTIEWDQKDQGFYDAQLEKFDVVLQELHEEGMTSDQIIQFAISQVKDAQVARNLEKAVTMIDINQLTPIEARDFLVETMKQSYSTGAAWNGYGWEVAIFPIVVVVYMTLLLSGKVPSNGSCYGDDCNFDQL